MKTEIPVFDRADIKARILDAPIEVADSDDSPIGRRVDRTAAERLAIRELVNKKREITAARMSIVSRGIAARQSVGQLEKHLTHANDNQDWPLARLLRLERRYAALMVAERYRKLADTAENDSLLSGQAYGGEELQVQRRTDLDESTGSLTDKGAQEVKPRPDEQTKRAGKPVPRPFNGDMPLISRIDARRELAILRGRLGPVLDYFEAAVCDRATLEDIGGRRNIPGKKSASGAGRALVDIGLEICAAHWRLDLTFDLRMPEAA